MTGAAGGERTIDVGAARLTLRLRGEGTPVVCLASLGRGAPDFDTIAAYLNTAGFQTVAVNLRGIEGSEGPLEGITLHDLAADVAGVIEALGVAPAHTLGHAFGNRVVRCLAADRPDLVRSVTLLAAGGKTPAEPEAASAFQRFFEPGLSDGERLQAVRAAHFAAGSDASVWLHGWWLDAVRAHGAATQAAPVDEWWEAGSAPLLVVQGLDDRMAPVANGRALKATLGDRARLVELHDAGHALLVEQPADVAKVVVKFLREWP